MVFHQYEYVDDLLKCFKEVKRVLKKKGLFVFSNDHPFFRTANSKTLKLKKSYFKIGKEEEIFSDPKKKFIIYNHKISDIYGMLVKAGFQVEEIIEPDSRKKYPYDPWYGLWDYTPKYLKFFPPTIIFKTRKIK